MELIELSSLEYKVEPVSPVDSPTSNADWTLASTARSDAADFGDEEEEIFESLWPSLTKEEEAVTSEEEDLFQTGSALLEDELLDIVDLEDIILKVEEPFSTWLDNTGLYENPPIATAATTPSQFYNTPTHSSSSLWTVPSEVKAYNVVEEPTPQTQDLFKEFEDVFSQTAGSLTPPDSPKSQTLHIPSPPQPTTQQLVLQQQASGSNSGYVSTFLQNIMHNNTVPDLEQMVVSDVAVINDPAVTLGEASPATSDDLPWSSPSPSSTSGGCSDSGFDDPDWNPQLLSDKAAVASSAAITTSSAAACIRRHTSSQGGGGGRRGGGRSRPAVGSTEERRMRKKEQNKNAATRYRMKKKQEMEEIVGEERVLVDKNERLKADATEITREIRYLKSLMRDLLKAKGLLSS